MGLIEGHCRLRCNARPDCWRTELAQWLRQWADALDGRRTLAVSMESEPPLPDALQAELLIKGLEHTDRLFQDAVRAELIERALPHGRGRAGR
jgi:hypothetical protein